MWHMSTVMPRFGVRQRNPMPARHLPSPLTDMIVQTLARADQELASPFKGMTTDGQLVDGLYPLQSTGVSTAPIVSAAQDLLEHLEAAQRSSVSFALQDDAWRRWNNTHPFIMRHGLLLETLDDDRRERALALLQAGLSERGFTAARNVMKLNHTIGELTGHWDEYGEWLYWLSLFGSPSVEGAWGWQIDGHHLNINCLLVGDQLSMTPLFMGSEPTYAESGKYAGTRTFEAEEQIGLAFARGLSAEQRAEAILFPSILQSDLPNARWHPTEGRIQGRALRDNLELPYEGLCARSLSSDQRERLLELVDVYVGRTREEHSRVRLQEVAAHLDETYFVWLGSLEDDGVFYYRIHSPVVMIEFDHLRGIALDNDEPARTHIHTVVRTPNGNDYGKDLLRQHYANSSHHRR
jgi:hypothetical protein